VSVAELLALLDALPANVALWDGDVRLRYANRRQLTRFGRPAEQLLGAHLADLVQPHAVEMSARYIEGALAGQTQQVERAMVDAHGQRYNAHQVTHVPNVVDGVVQGYCALAVDITASIEGFELARRHREQAALQAERDRIAGDIDEHRVVDDLNAALHRLDDAVNRASDALPSLSTAADAIERTIEELRATVPTRMVDDGRPAVVPVAFPEPSVPVDLPDQEPGAGSGVPWPPELTGAGWTARDAHALLDLLPAAVAIWDADLRNVFANRAALGWLGASDLGEVVGRPARELLGEEAFERNVGLASAALAGQPRQVDCTVVHELGLRHVQAAFLPREHDGVIDGVYTFVVDVTGRVEAELALQDARAAFASARERERIADELHNLVIQRLFAASLAASLPTAVTEAQLRSVQDGISAALEELESALSSLHENVGVLDLLPALATLVHDLTDPHGIPATIENVGSVEYVPPGLGSELLAVAHAALAHAVGRTKVRNVVLTVAADQDGVWLRVVDDGRSSRRHPPEVELADVRHRAEMLGGTCTVRPNRPRGTVVDWRVPTLP
jgi:PAS domain S-box-containing protein